MKTKFLVLAMLLVVVFSACGKPKGIPQAPVLGVNARTMADFWAKASNYYQVGASHEKDAVDLWNAAQQADSTMRTGASDLFNLKSGCFADVAKTESTIGEAVMSNMDSKAIVSALVTNSVTGEQATSKCVDQISKLSDYIVANRAAVQAARLASLNKASTYKLYLSDRPEVQWMNDLLKTYLTPQGVYEALADHNIPGITDWSWLPTKNLAIVISDMKMCDYYISGAFKSELEPGLQRMYLGHEESLDSLYTAQKNSARGTCTLFRMAALEYISAPILSQQTRDVNESGIDQGVIPTP